MTIQPEPFKHESRLAPGSDLFRHPLMCDLAILPTTAIEHFVNTVRTWLELLLPGALVIGNWRIGKSHATQFLARNLPELLGLHIPAYVLRIHDMEGKYVSRKEFFVELLRALGYGLTQRGNASDKFGSFEIRVGYATCGLRREKSSLPAIRKMTVRMVSSRV